MVIIIIISIIIVPEVKLSIINNLKYNSIYISNNSNYKNYNNYDNNISYVK